MAAIRVAGLRKTYTVPEREAGVGAALRSLAHRRTREVVAVDDISFAVEPGEVVGFLGPNGAGKTTALKMLAGLLYPSAGAVEVLGHTPQRREAAFLTQITLVMGNRQQLDWDIPAADSFELLRAVYRLPDAVYRAMRDELTELLDLAPLLKKPVRNLSLGERMKCEIAAALLHRPRVLFLDEPTLGLDVAAQRRIRAFIAEYNRKYGATVLLTSHYMADVQVLCRRVIVIHQGRLLYDGDLADLAARVAAHKTVTVELADEGAAVGGFAEVVEREGARVRFRVAKAEIAAVTGRLLAELPVLDLTVEDPPIEEVIERVFAGAALEPEAAPEAAGVAS